MAMLKGDAFTKPIVIDGEVREVPATATIADALKTAGITASSVQLPSGELISASHFRNLKAPDGFQTNLTEIEKGCCV
jgi:hypothetical protein